MELNAKQLLRFIAKGKQQSVRTRIFQKCPPVICRELNRLKRMEKEFRHIKAMLGKARITIEVSGGLVQNVYSNLETDVEVDICDFDLNDTQSDIEREEMEEYLRQIISEQRHIY